MLLIGLFVFRREAAGGFIWLGQQMVEPSPTSEPAKANPPITKPPVQDTKPPVQEAKPPVPEAKSPVQEAKPSAPEAKPPVPEAKPAQEHKTAPTNSQAIPKDNTARLQMIKSYWDEIAKGNVTSMLTLGSMYFTGHGVTKNCYQARRLFAAASRRGSLEGKQKLAELDRSSCPVAP
jgi:type IV secretory pathway VirB10-like protein